MFWKGLDGDNDSFWIRWWDTIFQFENRCGQIVICSQLMEDRLQEKVVWFGEDVLRG